MQAGSPYSRWRLLFGPWPFAPLPFFIFGVLAFAGRGVVVAGAASDSRLAVVATIAKMAAEGVVIMALIVLVVVVVGGWRPGAVQLPSRARYLVTLATSAAVATAGLLSLRLINDDPFTGKGEYSNPAVAAAWTIVFLLIMALAIGNGVGYTRFRVSEQTRQLREQVDELERQRTLIIEADERVRDEVATVLHDEVQGVLLRANLRLSSIAADESDERAAELRAIVAELEQLRGDGVRAVSRRLAPSIDVIGLGNALVDLARTYAGSIDVQIDLPESIESGDRAHAIYRIVEQALLNCAAHGRATEAAVRITRHEGRLTVEVDDNGRGLPETSQPGTGIAIIDAWTGVVGGSWSLESGPTGGTRLTASVPV